MKKNTFIVFISVLGLAVLFFVVVTNKKPPVILSSDTLLLHYNIDDLIKRSELIIIGEVEATLPSQWKDVNGNGSRKASPKDISRAHGLFTDSIISINQTLKGNVVQPVVRVRSFSGEIENIRWIDEASPPFVIKRTYLLFLAKDIGATAKVDSGDYVSVGAYQGVYEIINDKAISKTNEWMLEDLIAYIQNSLSLETATPTPTETPIPTDFLPPSSTQSIIETFTASPVPTVLPAETPIPTETTSPTP